MIRVGLIGSDIQASKSPLLHMSEARAKGFDLSYELFDLSRIEGGEGALEATLRSLQHQGFAGTNVTHPVKQIIMALLDEVSEDAKTLGAVNTVVFRDGRTSGYNTDWTGFSQNMRSFLMGASLAQIVQLGAGGAGSAVAFALIDMGVERLSLFDTDKVKASALAARLNTHFGAEKIVVTDSPASALVRADGVVNTTPIGMFGHPGFPIDPALLRSSLWVADVIYFPLETEFLRAAREAGCRTLNGGGMVVFQAAAGFKLFTGVAPEAARMMDTFERSFKS